MRALIYHHEAPGDPTLISWIMERIDHFLRLDTMSLVLIFGALIATIPITIIILYFLNYRIPEDPSASK